MGSQTSSTSERDAVSQPEGAPARPMRRDPVEAARGRLGSLTLPELRRIVITSSLLVTALALFVVMVHELLTAAFLGVVCAIYLRPLYRRLRSVVGSVTAAIGAMAILILPGVGALIYSYVEINGVLDALIEDQAQIGARVHAQLARLPYVGARIDEASVEEALRAAIRHGSALVAQLNAALAELTIAVFIYLLTLFYVLVDAPRIVAYLAHKTPPRYADLTRTLRGHLSSVLHGAVFAVLTTQLFKSLVVLALLLMFEVPLAAALTVCSFIIGFFPALGSWAVLVPVGGWLLIFKQAPWQALAVVSIGLAVNTVLFSLIIRPRIAASRTPVLDFYWMFVGLVAGVYAFGLAGVLLGPLLIGALRAVVDTVTATTAWDHADEDAAQEDAAAQAPRAAGDVAGSGARA